LAIGGQAPTLTAVDAELEPTHPAITWLDHRPSETAEQLYAGLGQAVPIWGSWPAQIAWFARTRAYAFQRSRWLLGCPDYPTARRRTRRATRWIGSPSESCARRLRMRTCWPKPPACRLARAGCCSSRTWLASGRLSATRARAGPGRA